MNQNAQTNQTAAVKVNDEWRFWIAENLLLHADPHGLLFAMTQAGISAEEGRAEIDAAINSPYLAGSQRLSNRLLKRNWVLDIQRKLNRLRPPEIPRKHKLSREEFLMQHYSVNQPVIITGMMDDWPAMQKWSLDYFQEKLSDREVEVQFGRTNDANYEINSAAHKQQMRFGDYIDLIKNSGETNDFYMTANNASKNHEALTELWDDVVQLPEYLQAQDKNRGFLWLGPKGTITPFHHDLTNNFMAQVMGRKRLLLIPACENANVYNNHHVFTPVDGRQIDLVKYPKMANAQVMECILEPGEVLFLPVGCLHFVEGLDVSVTITFTNFLWDNDFYTNHPPIPDF